MFIVTCYAGFCGYSCHITVPVMVTAPTKCEISQLGNMYMHVGVPHIAPRVDAQQHTNPQIKSLSTVGIPSYLDPDA